jgi:hypothetical protein
MPSGCLGLFWRISKPEKTWESEVTNLSEGIAALAGSLESGGNELEREVVRQQLYKLAEQLRAPKDTPAPVFLEGIRDSADRIQEPAGRLARRMTST